MDFLNPAILWGLAALGIPVLIHLWNGRKGITMAWAAVRFLEENNNKPARHIKFDQWMLLMVRLLLLALLVLLLSKLVWATSSNPKEKKVIHLVEPSMELLAEFKFELQQAINKGEQVFWLDQQQTELHDIESFSPMSENGPIYFGNLLTNKEDAVDNIHLYLSGYESAIEGNFIPVTVNPTLYVSNFSSPKKSTNLIQVSPNKLLYINELNQLELSDEPVENPGQVYDGTFTYFLDLESEKQVEIIKASLQAIYDVFELEFEESTNEDAQLYFTDQSKIDPKPDRIYWKTGNFEREQYANIYHLRGLDRGIVSIEAYEELPEQIVNDLLDFLEIKREHTRLTASQLQSRFHLLEVEQKPTQANTYEILWVLFLFVLVVERLLSNWSRV